MSPTLPELLDAPQYSLGKQEKQELLRPALQHLHEWHMQRSHEYKRIATTVFDVSLMDGQLEHLPFLPVAAFKNHQLKSISDEQVLKVLTSSGTTGQQLSKIYLDREAAQLQTRSLSKIIGHILGQKRLPMLVIDSKAVFANPKSFSARAAGILGLAVFGKDHTYVLDENFELDLNSFEAFLERHNGAEMLIFGFTFMVWLYLYQAKTDKKYDLSKAILLHSGGWKKLTDLAVTNEVFKAALQEKFNLHKVYNFYGMIEQIGSVFVENSEGYLHCPNFAEVLIRNPKDFSLQPKGVPGLIQLISALPESYPGHSILTEDIGVLMGEDDASNGWKGKYFKIIGRAKKAELRGCSDTFKTS